LTTFYHDLWTDFITICERYILASIARVLMVIAKLVRLVTNCAGQILKDYACMT
jgi:hypothetical protein